MKSSYFSEPSIRVFQIHYHPDHEIHLEREFIPFDNEGVNDPFLEIGVIRRLNGSPEVHECNLWGAVSWKFRQKTGLTGAQWLDYINSHSGFDAYYCNPFPDLEGLFQNFWIQGKISHPELIDIAHEVFARADVELPSYECNSLQSSERFAAANYIVATPEFWGKYLRFINAVTSSSLATDAPLRDRLLSVKADPTGVHAGASYLPFLVERLFGTYMATADGRNFRYHKIPLPACEEKMMDVHLKRLRELKDLACSTRSEWLTDCWKQYRNLYIAATRPQDWVLEHLPTFSPDSIILGPSGSSHRLS